MTGLLGAFVLATIWIQVDGSVYNGYAARLADYPHHVLVGYQGCAGSLIAPLWVLTSVPWYKFSDNFAGDGDTAWATYDYQLLELTAPVLGVPPARMWVVPEPPQGTRVLFPSEDVSKYFNDKDPKAELYQGELSTMADAECRRRLEWYDPATMLCAVGSEPAHSSACYDTGSGLMAAGKLLGVISWVESNAFGCGADRVVVSARISTSAVQDWIRTVTGNHLDF